jgi:uncharacterized RDD family membrane protein YckC
MTGSSTATAPDARPERDARVVAASLRRRMMAFLYEGVLLFGVLYATGLVYGVAMHQTNASEHRAGLFATCFFVLGLYFVGTWTHGGQTLALKTWHLRVVTDTGEPLPPRRALMRYVASWLWFVPPVLLAWAALPHTVAVMMGTPVAWIVAYALSTRLHPRRQFWHDALCNTAIVAVRPAVVPGQP